MTSIWDHFRQFSQSIQYQYAFEYFKVIWERDRSFRLALTECEEDKIREYRPKLGEILTPALLEAVKNYKEYTCVAPDSDEWSLIGFVALALRRRTTDTAYTPPPLCRLPRPHIQQSKKSYLEYVEDLLRAEKLEAEGEEISDEMLKRLLALFRKQGYPPLREEVRQKIENDMAEKFGLPVELDSETLGNLVKAIAESYYKKAVAEVRYENSVCKDDPRKYSRQMKPGYIERICFQVYLRVFAGKSWGQIKAIIRLREEKSRDSIQKTTKKALSVLGIAL